jgi:hypothetical protein
MYPFPIEKNSFLWYFRIVKNSKEVAAVEILFYHWSVLPPLQRHNTQHKASIR